MKTKNIFKIKKLFLLFSLILSASLSAQGITAQEAIDKARTKIKGAKSLSADFVMKIGAQTVKGNLVSKGSKFAIITNASSNWYNGTTLYTYMPSDEETTVFNPTRSELAEINPLLYIDSASQFKITGSKTKKAGVETIVMIPSKGGTGLKNIYIDLDAKTFMPKTIKVTPTSGSTIELNISNIKFNGQYKDATFEYPKDKYKNIKINDMR